jgi:exonuclease-1
MLSSTLGLFSYSLAIDGYVWLHKGAFGCAEDLVTGSKTTKLVFAQSEALEIFPWLKHHLPTPSVLVLLL